LLLSRRSLLVLLIQFHSIVVGAIGGLRLFCTSESLLPWGNRDSGLRFLPRLDLLVSRGLWYYVGEELEIFDSCYCVCW